MKREEFTGEDKAVFAGFVTACVVVGIIIGMALMYGWLALNGEIKALDKVAEAVMMMVA